MEEVDEFGIPIKKQATTEVAVDEFGIPVKKKELTTTTSQKQPVSQPIQPSKQNGTVNEPIDLPQSYQSDRSNYKELVGGKKYNLLRGGKPITGTWDETTQTFIKDPLLNITPQQKKEVGFLQAVEAGVNLETPVETQEEMFGRVGVDIDNLKTDARQKISNIEYIASYPSVQRLAELDKLKQSTNDATVVADIDKQIADLRSKKMNDKEFTGIRFDNSEGKVYQNTLPTKPFEEFKGDVKKLPKTDLTVGQAYDEIKDDSDYVQQVQSEISGYNNMVNQYMISKLPEETKAKLEAIKGTPEYDAELERELVQSKNIENVIPALTYGLDKKLDALMEVGSNLGLDDDKLIQKKLGDIREKELFGKTMASTRAELASSIGGMLPDLAAGAVWSPLMLASMASTMPNDFLEQSIAEQSQSGEPIDVAKAKKFALTSTAAQTGMLVGAGKLGSHGLNLVSKTALKRAGELIYEMAKRGTKDAIVFGGLGTVMQNKINKAYDLSENDEYLKSALHMAVIGGMFALKEGLGKVGGVTKKASNEVDYLASYLPEEYTKKQVEQLVALGKTTAADGEETLDKLNTYRTIRNQLPVDLSMGQMEKIYPLWQQKREIHNMVEGASSEFKSVLNGQVEDIDRKILIEAAIPLTSAERMEKSKLTTGEAEGKQIDKARLRYLEKRDEAAKEAKKEVKEAAQAEEVKPVEPAKPKEEKPVVPVVEKPKPVKAGQLNQADVVAEKAPVSDLEVKKADIERRRQEELKGEEYRTTTISELWKDDEGNFYKTQKLANGQVKVDLVDENGRTLSTLGSFDGSLSIETIVNGGTKDTYGANNLTLTKVKDLEFTNKIVDKINAKYDAELAALEKPVEEVKPTETEPKPFTRERQPQEVGETETIVSKPASGQVAETVGDAHLKVSADVKTALDNSRKKQVVSVDKDGNQIVDEVDFTKDDADVELDRLEALAARGKLTEQEFLSSFFGQATDTATFAEVKRALKSDAVGFIKKLRQSFEGGKVEQPPVETEQAEAGSVGVEKPKIDYDKAQAIFNIEGEVIEIPLSESMIAALKEKDEVQRIQSQNILRQQAYDKYNEEIKASTEQSLKETPQTETEQADGVEKTLVTKRAYKGTFREEVKRALEEIGLTRDIENQAEVDAKTDQFIKEVGMDAALESVRNFVVKGAAAAAILGKRIDAIDKELKDTENFDKFTELVQEQAAILEELGQLNLDAGRLNAYMNRIYQNSDAGYKTAIQKNRWEKAFGEEPPKEIMEAWQERDKQIADLTERVKRLEEEQATKEAQDAVNEIKESVGREKTRKTRSKKADDLIAEGLDELDTALGGKKMAMGDRSPQVWKALEKIGRGLIEKGIATIENVAEKVREYVEEKYPNKLNFADYEEGFADAIQATMSGDKTTGKIKISKSLIRELVGNGITDVNELVKAVKERIADEYPNATDREIRDAITGYGKTSNPNKEEIEAKVRKLKNLGRVISGLEDVAEGKRPLKSGFQRDKPDVEVRAAQKELREAMKDLPIDAKTLEGHLKTALDSIKQRLSNQIEDFNREIKTGEETPKNERTVEYDEDANWLKEERDRVKAIRDEIFGKSELTDEQRIDIATKALEKSIERKKEMLGSGDIMPKPKASKTPETPELKRLRTENEILQDEINALRKKQKDAENPPKTKEQIATENAIEANKKSIEEKERRIRENDLAPKPSKEVADKNNAELKSLRTKNGLLDKQLQKLRNDAKQKRSAEEIATENKIKALERKAADIQDKIKKGELEAVKKESKVDKTNPKYIAAKNKAEAALEELKKLQKVAGIPEKRRLDLTKKATERRIAELKKKLAEGDFTKKTRKPLIADTELIRAKAEKLRLQEEYDKEFYKHELENRTDWQKAKDRVADAWGLARGLSATGEASFVGIQGLVQTIAHPIYAAEAFKNATKFLFSEKKTEEWLRRLKQQEFYPVMKEAKLALTEPSAKITAREELYNSGWTDLAWNMLVSPAKLRSKSAYEAWKKGNPIRAIERASVGYLDTLRVMRFLDGMEILEAKGKHIAKDKEDYKDLADMINTLTGRASLGFAEQIAEPMSKVLFSPRNWASQVKTATPYALYHFGKMTPTARKMAVQDFSKFVGLTTGMVMMAAAGLNNDDDPETGVEFDPRSSDFMKIRWGKKRVDPWGGRIQQIVFTSRLFMDFLHDVAPKLSEGGMKTGSGDIVPLGTPYKAKTKEEVAIQMAINKLAPSASLMEKYIASHKNKNDVRVDEYGKELDLWKSAKESMRPIFWGTVNDLLKDDPGALNGLLGFAAFFGYGVNVYEDKVKKEKTKDERPKRPERPERPKR